MGIFDFFFNDEPRPKANRNPRQEVKSKPSPKISSKANLKPICPSCKQPIETLPKRAGTCIHCKQKYYICKDPKSGEYIFTNDEGKKGIEIKKQQIQDRLNSKYAVESWNSVYENSEGVKKVWMTSGWGNEREKHLYYESLGPVDMDYEYSPGLKYPCDPHAKDKDEIKGCNCTIIYKTEI